MNGLEESTRSRLQGLFAVDWNSRLVPWGAVAYHGVGRMWLRLIMACIPP